MQGKPSFLDYFSSIKEKRNKVKLQHSLEELFLVALCAVNIWSTRLGNHCCLWESKITIFKKIFTL